MLILCVCYPQVKDIMLTVPNAITISRIMASPLISWCILDSQWEAALAGVNIRLPYDIYLLWRTSIFMEHDGAAHYLSDVDHPMLCLLNK